MYELPFPESSPSVTRKTNYSWETSKPAFDDVTPGRISNEEKIYAVVKRLKQTCLKEIANITGIEQGTVSARINTLIEKGKVIYGDKENYIEYKGRLRKKVLLNS